MEEVCGGRMRGDDVVWPYITTGLMIGHHTNSKSRYLATVAKADCDSAALATYLLHYICACLALSKLSYLHAI